MEKTAVTRDEAFESRGSRHPKSGESHCRRKVDFVAIATPLVNRGFRVNPFHPETRWGVVKNWQNWQITTPAEVSQIFCRVSNAQTTNVGVVGKRGVGPFHCFLDVECTGRG